MAGLWQQQGQRPTDDFLINGVSALMLGFLEKLMSGTSKNDLKDKK
jgi:hypothetical protein